MAYSVSVYHRMFTQSVFVDLVRVRLRKCKILPREFLVIWKRSVPIQVAQCWLSGLAIYSAKI